MLCQESVDRVESEPYSQFPCLDNMLNVGICKLQQKLPRVTWPLGMGVGLGNCGKGYDQMIYVSSLRPTSYPGLLYAYGPLL